MTDSIKVFHKGENLFKEGETAFEAYLIKKGRVSVWRMENGRRLNLAVRLEDDVVGEMALVDEVPRSATVTADTEVEVQVITKESLEKMLEQSPPVIAAILRQVFESLRCANDLVSMYASRP